MVNFPPRQIGPFMSEVLTLGMPDATAPWCWSGPTSGTERRTAVLSGRAYATVTWDQLHRDARALAPC